MGHGSTEPGTWYLVPGDCDAYADEYAASVAWRERAEAGGDAYGILPERSRAKDDPPGRRSFPALPAPDIHRALIPAVPRSRVVVDAVRQRVPEGSASPPLSSAG
jgi:hypothetical protein